MENKILTADNATIVNPWDESSLAKELFEQVKSGFETNTDLTEECFWEGNNMKFYILCPRAIKASENHFFDNFHYAYSMIFGYFLIDDGIRKYKFYSNEKTFLEILGNMFFSENMDKVQEEFYVEICHQAKCLVKYKIVEHFKKECNIENGFCCKECKCKLDENSFSAIIESNPEIINFMEEKYINCPNCSTAIEIDENIKDKLRSFETIYKYRLFSEQLLGEEFEIKYIANLMFDKKYSKVPKKLNLKKINDPLFQELFGISKSDFNRVWYFFRKDISNHVGCALTEFYFYETDQKYKDFIESKRGEALKFMRRKKIKRINEKSME